MANICVTRTKNTKLHKMMDIYWHNKTLIAQAIEECVNPRQKALDKVEILEKKIDVWPKQYGHCICH